MRRGIPTVLDRFVQQALLQVLQPRFDPTFSEASYGLRHGPDGVRTTPCCMKERVRELTRRSAERSLMQMCKPLRVYLAGWKAYFRLAETPSVFADLDGWIRHRLHAVQLKHWKRGRVIYRELVARGMPDQAARRVAANGRRWWHNSAMDLHIALPNRVFDKLGVPRLAR